MSKIVLTVERIFSINENTQKVISGILSMKNIKPIKESKWEFILNGVKKDEIIIDGEILTGNSDLTGLLYSGNLFEKESIYKNKIELCYLCDL